MENKCTTIGKIIKSPVKSTIKQFNLRILYCRAPRLPQSGSSVRQRMKRPMQQALQVQQQNNSAMKQRRMDVLLPDRNEDADCHVIAQQKRNDGLPVIQNVQGATTQQTNRNDSTIHLTDSITLSVRQPGTYQYLIKRVHLNKNQTVYIISFIQIPLLRISLVFFINYSIFTFLP